MNAHILNISIEEISRTGRLWFSPHDSGNIKVFRTILVLPGAHQCAHASVSKHLNTGCTFCEQQREPMSKCSEMDIGVSCGENCTLLALFVFSTKMIKTHALILRLSAEITGFSLLTDDALVR
jgi:hypothetical protein